MNHNEVRSLDEFEDGKVYIHDPNQDSSSSYKTSDNNEISDEAISRNKSERHASPIQQTIGKGKARETVGRILSAPQAFQNPSNAQKRKLKATQDQVRKVKAARLAGSYSNDYRKLLNADIQDAAAQRLRHVHLNIPSSQVGISLWSSGEKDLFFTALARLGKDDIVGIASRIGTKSALEVREYILLLHQGMVEKNQKELRHEMLGFSDFPAACEVSREGEAELEKAADALSFRQERYEEQAEEKRWGTVPWLLDSTANSWILEAISDDDKRPALVQSLPSTELLNLGNFLELSRCIFMNPSSSEEENWQFLIEAEDEEPSIRTTAFEDFHRLAISITKRLVASAIFCTLSRLRATDSKAPVVKSADVHAASRTIGMKLNSDDFWTGCSRRCHLDVYRRKADHEPMSYDEVETIMKRTENNSGPSSAPFPSCSIFDSLESDSESSKDSLSDTADVYSIPRDLAAESLSRLSPSPSSDLQPAINISDSASEPQAQTNHPIQRTNRASLKLLRSESLASAHNHHAALIDLHASLMEEKKLWKVMKKEPPFEINPDSKELRTRLEVHKAPEVERKEEEELSNWRDKIRFGSQWEVYEREIPGDASNVARKLAPSGLGTESEEKSNKNEVEVFGGGEDTIEPVDDQGGDGGDDADTEGLRGGTDGSDASESMGTYSD